MIGKVIFAFAFAACAAASAGQGGGGLQTAVVPGGGLESASPSSIALPMEREAWEKYQPLGGEFEDGRYVQRREGAPSFELSRIVPPSSNIVVEAVVVPERTAGGGASGTLGVVVWEGHFRWRRMGLAFGRDGRRTFELIELRDGARMPESNLPAEPARGSWEFGEPVTLRLSLGDGAVEGEARSADGTLLFHRRLPVKPGAVASGIPGFSQYLLQGRFDSFTASIGAPLPDTRDEPRRYPRWPSPDGGNCNTHAETQRRGEAKNPKNSASSAPLRLCVENNRFYRTARDGAGKWWFVDPAGGRMFLSGIGVVNYRGHYSAALGYAPYYRTVQSKYPTLDDWATNTLRRIGDWGFNFLSSPSENLLRRGFPHAGVVNHGMGQNFACYGDEFDLLPCDGGPCSGFPNVFHPLWPAYCRYAAQSFCRTEREDPWVLGWYTDNELSWWGDKRQFKTPPARGLFDAAARKDDSHPAKQALRAFLAERGIARPEDADESATREFVRLCARKYFEATTEAIREADPNHLILGCRFAGLTSADPVVWEECGRFCDAVSVNIYPMVDLDRGVALGGLGRNHKKISDMLGERARLAGKPAIVTEWCFSALDSGLPCTHGAGQRFFTQKERAEATSVFARTLWSMPECGGYVYFMWCDQPAVGKSGPQSENTNYGLVNADDEPYEEQVAALAAVQLRPEESRAAPLPQEREVVPPTAEEVVAALALEMPDAETQRRGESQSGNDGITPKNISPAENFAPLRLCVENNALHVGENGALAVLLREYSRGSVWWSAASALLELSPEGTALPASAPVAPGQPPSPGMEWSRERTALAVLRGSAANGEPFEADLRLHPVAGRPLAVAELLAVRNCGGKPLPFDAAYFRLLPADPAVAEETAAARGDDVFAPPAKGQPTPIPPQLWRPWESGAWLLPDGSVLGMLSPRKTGFRIRFWRDNIGMHADAECAGARRTLAPGETWAPDPAPFVIAAEIPGGEDSWRDLCKGVRTAFDD